jgi:nucleoid-associated protein YgaU
MALEKAKITNTVTNESPIEVMFNPEEYTVNKDNNFAQQAIPGLSAPILQFVNGNMQTLEMELFLDTYESNKSNNRVLNQAGGDVRELTKKITGLMDIERTTHAPPILLFTWGSLSFTCVLARVNQRFIMFMPDGTPVRARLTVTFNEFRNVDLEAKEIKRETADFTKFHMVGQGETLSAIADRLYGNPKLWRPIALRNHIENPRKLRMGVRLTVPQLPYRNPETGEVYQ